MQSFTDNSTMKKKLCQYLHLLCSVVTRLQGKKKIKDINEEAQKI